MAKELPPGRRPLVRNEVLFTPSDRQLDLCDNGHTWIDFTLGPGETVIACGVCGHVKKGETMPAHIEPQTRDR